MGKAGPVAMAVTAIVLTVQMAQMVQAGPVMAVWLVMVWLPMWL